MAKYSPFTFSDGTPNQVSAARLNELGAGLREASMGRSTTFPSSPVDGDIHVYPADTTNGVMWMFMYRSAPNDWEFIGGSPLFAEVTTQESTASSSYTALATAGPSIAIPFVGDFDVEIGARMTSDTDSNQCRMSYDIGGTGAVDADSIWYNSAATVTAGAGTYTNGSRSRRKTGLTAVTLTAKYKRASGASNVFFGERWMKVTPVRHTP